MVAEGDWAKWYPIEKIRKMYINGDLTEEELLELSVFNFNLFCDLILDFPYSFSENQKLIGETLFNPENEFDELWVACGRKSAKTEIASALTLFQVYRLLNLEMAPQKFFGISSGKPIYAVSVSVSREQAYGVAFSTIKGLAENSWYLSRYIEDSMKDTLIFPYNIRVVCLSTSSRSVRGYPTIINLYDELAHFMDTNGNLSGSEVYEALHPNLKPCRVPSDSKFFPMAISVGISSPAGMHGIFWDNFKTGVPIKVIQSTPEHGSHTWRAVLQLPTWEMNPKLPFDGEEMQKELTRNPDKFWMEYGAKFCDVVQAAIPRDLIYLCAGGFTRDRGHRNIGEMVTDKTTPRIIALDPALTGDGYALAMGHYNAKKDIVKIDLVQVWEARSRNNPVNIEAVENRIRNLCERFNIRFILLDQYQSASTIQRLRREGLPVHKVPPQGIGQSKFNQMAYEYMLDRIRNQTIKYPYHSRLLDELTFLQRKETSTTVRYEAASGHHDDLCDCIARICFYLSKFGGRSVHVG